MTDKDIIKALVEDIHFLLDYARRVAQGQVRTSDPVALQTIRDELKKVKEECGL